MWFYVDCVNEDIDHDSEQNHDFDGISVKIVMEKTYIAELCPPIAIGCTECIAGNAGQCKEKECKHCEINHKHFHSEN